MEARNVLLSWDIIQFLERDALLICGDLCLLSKYDWLQAPQGAGPLGRVRWGSDSFMLCRFHVIDPNRVGLWLFQCTKIYFRNERILRES